MSAHVDALEEIPEEAIAVRVADELSVPERAASLQQLGQQCIQLCRATSKTDKRGWLPPIVRSSSETISLTRASFCSVLKSKLQVDESA